MDLDPLGKLKAALAGAPRAAGAAFAGTEHAAGALGHALAEPYHAAGRVAAWDAQREHNVNQHLSLSNEFVKQGMHPFDAQRLAGRMVYGDYAHDPALQAHYMQVMQQAGIIPYQVR